MSEAPGTAVIPHTGEVINLDDPEKVAAALRDLRMFESKARELKRLFVDTLANHASVQGTKTLRLDGQKLQLKGGPASETVWDVSALRELLRLGLPEERWQQLVTSTVEWKVNANVAKQLASVNPEYRRVIEAAQTKIDKPWSVS